MKKVLATISNETAHALEQIDNKSALVDALLAWFFGLEIDPIDSTAKARNRVRQEIALKINAESHFTKIEQHESQLQAERTLALQSASQIMYSTNKPDEVLALAEKLHSYIKGIAMSTHQARNARLHQRPE